VATFALGAVLFVAFQALGLGPALWLRARTRLPSRYLALLIAAGTASVSYGVFWIAIVAPRLRSPAAAAAVVASLALAAWSRRRGPSWQAPGREAWLPPLLAGALAAAWIAPLVAGPPPINARLAWVLPADNVLPGLFAARIMNGEALARPVPPLWAGGDRATERPPLQTAVVIGVSPLLRGTTPFEYQLLATVCQAQWLPALWLLAVACGVRGRRLAFVLAACVLSGFFYVNTVYTWPKLFAAALMLGAFAIALEPPAGDAAADRDRTILTIALCALALLAHPGPVFTLIAIPVCWPLLRPIVRLRWTYAALAAGVVVAAALVAPWLAYQTLVDPPAGRLLREHFADGRRDGTAVQAIVAANLARPFGEQVRVRLGNVAAQVGDATVALWPFPWQHAQREQFFHQGASLGVLLVGLVLVLVPRTRAPDAGIESARRLAMLGLVALLIWSLLVFPAGGALVHHGSPVTTALLFFAGGCGVTRLPLPGQLIAVGLHGAFFLVWWMPILRAAAP
jgi:hypothetical protein